MKLFAGTLLAGALAFPATASWTLDNSDSQLYFLTTKNAQITELHQFEELQGTMEDNGQLSVTVLLASVNTNIEIRDTRMQEKLFMVDQFPHATFTAQLPPEVIQMPSGTATTRVIEGAIDLHDKNVATTFNVAITRLDDTTFQVTTVAPTLLSAGDFGLAEGVELLQGIAGLNSITLTVPVTFSVQFDQQAD